MLADASPPGLSQVRSKLSGPDSAKVETGERMLEQATGIEPACPAWEACSRLA